MSYTITELMPTGLITLEEPPAEKAATIEHLLDLAVETDRVSDRDATLSALMQRIPSNRVLVTEGTDQR